MSKTTFQGGAEGEELVIDHLKQRGCSVVDLRNDPEYQAKDIDLSILTPQKNWRTLEIKTDTRMHKTGNIMIELSMSRKTGLYDGWFYKCKADILCYVDAHAGNLLFLPWEKLRQYTTRLMAQEPSCICSFKNPYDAHCIGRGVLLSVKQHLIPNDLILKVSHSETIKSAVACWEAGLNYVRKDNSSVLVIPA